jgi:hypothetical protein
MTTTTGTTRSGGRATPGGPAHVRLRDDRGALILRRLRPWHRMLARCAAARLDRQLAAGASPEDSVSLTARAVQLTSMTYRRDLAASLQRILAAAGTPAAIMPVPVAPVHPPRIPLRWAQIRQSAVPLATLARHLAEPGPVAVQGMAMVSQLVTDGTGPLYCDAWAGDLDDLIGKATRALAR